eukprot:Ihof_evm6s22 gene=Ihof_evmTU6s22
MRRSNSATMLPIPVFAGEKVDMTKPRLSFEETILDAPQFRTDLNECELGFKTLENQLKVLIKSSKKMVEQVGVYSQCASTVANDIQNLGALETEDPLAAEALCRVALALNDVESLRRMATEHTTKTLVEPMKKFIDKSLGEIKEGKKVYDQLSGNLDQTRNKACAASKKKDDEYEMAKNVLDASKNVFTYISLDYVYQLNKLIGQRRYEILEKVVSFMFSQLSFHHQCYNTLKEIEPMLRLLMTECQTRAEQLKTLDREMEKRHELVAVHEAEVEAETHLQALEKKTEVQLTCPTPSPVHQSQAVASSTSLGSNGDPTSSPRLGDKPNMALSPSPPPNNFLSPNGTATTTTACLPNDEKPYKYSLRRGYLYARGVKKGSRSWHRYYAFIQNSTLYFQLREPGSKPFSVTPLALSTVKNNPDVDRRFCFELITPQSNIILQAMDQQSVDAWMAMLQSQIAKALDNQQNTPRERDAVSLHGSSSDLTQLSDNLLSEFQAVDGNKYCCDCGKPDAAWASINLGILLCIECSGVHRCMGTHVSKVRSVRLDNWEPETIALMKGIGNKRSNMVYEADVGKESSDLIRPTAITDREGRVKWIRAKYVSRLFVEQRGSAEEESERLFNACKNPDGLLDVAGAIARGVKLDWQVPEHDMWSSLHACAYWNNTACGEYLVQNMASINIRDSKGCTPMHLAAELGNTDFVLFLLKRGANYDLKDDDGNTPLELAIAGEHPNCVTQLRMFHMNMQEGAIRQAARERTFYKNSLTISQ